ncbi:mechanosensitive ion channel domain-containing protein [Waddlia chondrophila]|uniref:Putative mechanosensitive ion channel n=1 Tax=Waddlia chondrophila (strain ATCC VR-1470 / WSU 86-1044) TaxID=716544 RepID=D6YW36_WADCW|nr:mechanosensitive ion channel domain-containing protein [Waddlia chondrophila]ADI38347.1 putative mechanosensitive ion channel [Waddlia chondrophila WSU 86-1044]
MDRKRFFLFFISILFLLTSALIADQEKEKEPSTPSPLELKQNWWEFFDVSDETLKSRLDTFKKENKALLSSLSDKEHEEIHRKMDQVFLMLDLYAKKKEEVQPSSAPQLQLLEFYTLDQLVEVYERLQRSEMEIGILQSKIKIQQSRINRLQNTLDRSILLYQNLSPATYEKLKQGVLLISQRAEHATLDLELQRDKKALTSFLERRDLYRNELVAAKKRLKIDAQTLDELKKKSEKAKSSYFEAEEKFYQLEKQSRLVDKDKQESKFTCCIQDSQILSQAISLENFKIKLLINEMKTTLAKLALNHREIDSDDIREFLSDWKRRLGSIEEQRDFWDTEIKNYQAQVSQMTAQSMQEGSKGQVDQEDLIGDIHFELDRSLAELELLKLHIENGEFLERLVGEQLVEKKSFMQTWLISLKNSWSKFKNVVDHWIHVTLFHVNEQPVTLMTFISALLIFLGGIVFSHYLRKFLVKRKIVQRKFSYSTEYIVLRVIHYAIVILAFLVALSFIGLNFTNLAIIAGALGVGIGFGLQTIVSNVSSGFMLLLKKYLKVGDIIELSDKQLGTITAVNLQNTIIRTFDGAEIMIPNSQLSSQRLTNWTMKDNAKRLKIPFGVAYGTDKNLVREAVVDSIKKLSFVYSDDFRYHDPQVWLMGFGESSVNFELVAWINLNVPVPYETASSALFWELDTTLKNKGIEMPFSQRDLYIKSFPSGILSSID